jgi:hypothetical protein
MTSKKQSPSCSNCSMYVAIPKLRGPNFPFDGACILDAELFDRTGLFNKLRTSVGIDAMRRYALEATYSDNWCDGWKQRPKKAKGGDA